MATVSVITGSFSFLNKENITVCGKMFVHYDTSDVVCMKDSSYFLPAIREIKINVCNTYIYRPRTREGNIYCPYSEGMGKVMFSQASIHSHLLGGGTPIWPTRGVPPSQVRMRGYPIPGPSGAGGVPHPADREGTHPGDQGVSHPADWGVSHPRSG